MRNKLTNMIKQMGNHRDCHDEMMSNLINHRLNRKHADQTDHSGSPAGHCMNNFRDRCANLKAISGDVPSSDADTGRGWKCRTFGTLAGHMAHDIRCSPDTPDDCAGQPEPSRTAESNSDDIYVNYNCKNNQIDKQNVNHQSNSTYAHCSSTRRPHSSSIQLLTLLTFTLTLTLITAQTSVTFEKLTNRDYSGFTYYTIRNVSLYECLGWCREEQECNAAVFSFIVNPLAPIQDTTCKLLNETYSEKMMRVPSEINQFGGTKDLVTKTSQIGGSKGGGESQMLSEETQVAISLQPQKAANLYFFTKIKLDSDSVCNRLWSFERYPNKSLRSGEKESVVTFKSTKEACLTACQAETNFICRSVEYHYLSNQCHLSQFDRRSSAISNELIDQDGVDYFENSCIESSKICLAQREYDTVRIGLPPNKISYYVEINYYPDKELLVKTQTGCLRACSMENEFICRSILYRANYKPGQPNCALYHLDHFTLPDGLDTFAVKYNAPLPLFDTGDGSDATYLEAICSNTSDMMNTIQQSTQFSQMPMSPVAMSSVNRPTIVSAISTSTLPPTKTSSFGTKQQQTTAQYQEQQTHQNKHILQALDSGVKSSQIPTLTTTFPSYGSSPNTLTSSTKVHQHHPPTSLSPSKTNAIKGGLNLMQQQTGAGSLNFVQNITIGTTTPSSCDTYGVCYQVSLRCTDTRITVNVRTSQPFHGRIYALGRSETCNEKINNLQYFSLEMPLSGQQQDCNTQNVQGVYSNTVVLQHHNVVLTKADKVYHVRCTYETTSRNVSFGMVPVRDAVMGSGFGTEPVEVSASPEAPLPRIVIESGEGREANTVRVGDKLTFKIAIPDNTPYGIFARSCHAMAKDARSTFEIIDANGCPVDPSIFPSFQLNGNALESTYEAFRFTESYGVIFQCNIKYCIGRCEPILCPTQTSQQGIFGRDSGGVQSYGRRRRRDLGEHSDRPMSTSQSTNGTRTDRRSRLTTKRRQARGRSREDGETLVKHLKNDEMTLSREILVLDINDPEPQRSDLDYTTLNAKELMMLNMDHCASTTSLMALSIISGLLLVLYVCTLAYFTSQQRNYQARCKSLY